jgi:hypothetical protein
MTGSRDLSSGWITYEVYQRDSKGNFGITPFSDTLASSGTLPTQAITKMRNVQTLGWPEAKRVLKDDYGHPLVVPKDEVIWLLKCKPSCWRLYFCVWKGGKENEKEKRIIYLYAVCKKQDDEDPADAIEARRVYDGIRPGGSGITLFEFPTR